MADEMEPQWPSNPYSDYFWAEAVEEKEKEEEEEEARKANKNVLKMEEEEESEHELLPIHSEFPTSPKFMEILPKSFQMR